MVDLKRKIIQVHMLTMEDDEEEVDDMYTRRQNSS